MYVNYRIRKVFDILHKILLGLVLAYASVLVFLCTATFMFAQSRDDIDRRVSALEAQNLEHRITVMETILADMQNSALWMRLNMGGTGLLIAEAVTRTVRRKPDKGLISTDTGSK